MGRTSAKRSVAGTWSETQPKRCPSSGLSDTVSSLAGGRRNSVRTQRRIRIRNTGKARPVPGSMPTVRRGGRPIFFAIFPPTRAGGIRRHEKTRPYGVRSGRIAFRPAAPKPPLEGWGDVLGRSRPVLPARPGFAGSARFCRLGPVCPDSLDQPVSHGPHRRLSPPGDAELFEDVVDVFLDRFDADVQRPGDFLVAQAESQLP